MGFEKKIPIICLRERPSYTSACSAVIWSLHPTLQYSNLGYYHMLMTICVKFLIKLLTNVVYGCKLITINIKTTVVDD